MGERSAPKKYVIPNFVIFGGGVMFLEIKSLYGCIVSYI